MDNIAEKAQFLKSEFTARLAELDENKNPKWGKMNVLQMIEHMSEYVRIASGKIQMSLISEPERLPKLQGFLMSDKNFPENTPNVLMPDVPPPARHTSKAAAIKELQHEIDEFFSVYSTDETKKYLNPFFGELDKDMQIQLLYKHSTHHLRQFGVIE